MVSDANIKDFYLCFISSAKKDIIEYTEKLKEVKKIKQELYNYINDNKNKLLESFNLNITNYDLEWIKQQYNDSEALYNRCIRYINVVNEHPNKIILLQVIKYCNTLRNEYNFNRLINLALKRKNLTFKEYRKYIKQYFIKVHQCVLEGMGYEFSYGIGIYLITRWKTHESIKPVLDYAETNKRKKELIAKGIKIYNDLEATWYKARNIPYNGVDYRVFKKADYLYEIGFINSTIFSNNNLEYERNEYVNRTLRGMGYKEIADKYCKSINDIYSLPLDIKYKLNILLYMFPNKYLNFIRNAEQDKREYRKNNSKNRQRF